jgi:WD40 repeat protein
MKSYNDGIDEVKDRVFVFIGDEQGYLKVWDFTSVIEKSGIRKIKPLRETKSAFNPFRLEKVNCSDLAAQVRKIKRKPLPPLLEPGTIAMQVREVKAHDEVISCIEFIDLNDFKGLITCSSDLKVRNWNFSLDLLGSINMKTEKIDDKWTFKTRKLIEKREHNIKELEEIIGEFNDSELFLKGPRRKLIIDENYKEEKKEEKKIERSNWLTIQLERDRHEKKLEEEN